jgi:hypothetical protein
VGFCVSCLLASEDLRRVFYAVEILQGRQGTNAFQEAIEWNLQIPL